MQALAVAAMAFCGVGCAPAVEVGSTRFTVSGPAAEVKRFVAAEQARSPGLRVKYEAGAGQAVFELSSADEAVRLSRQAMQVRLSHDIETRSIRASG